MPAATKAPTEPKPKARTAFLSQSDVEATAKDTAADPRYVNVSKLTEGKLHRFRFMAPGITGYVGWLDNNKPIRWHELPEELPANIRRSDEGKIEHPKRFIAGLVWDYQRELLAIMELTQKSIIKEILSIMADDDFGDPQEFDIKISKEGSGLQTKYSVKGGPLKAAPAAALAAIEDEDFFCNLDNMFYNLDPYDPEASSDKDEDDEDEEEDDEEEYEEEETEEA